MRLFSILVLLLAAPIANATVGDATESMLADLEAGLRNLEAEAFGIEEAPKALVDEVERIREDATYLRVKMRKHNEAGRSGTGVEGGEVRSLIEDIERVRRELRQLDSDRISGTFALPEGTEVYVRLMDTLTTETARVGDRFAASSSSPSPGSESWSCRQERASMAWSSSSIAPRAGRIARRAWVSLSSASRWTAAAIRSRPR